MREQQQAEQFLTELEEALRGNVSAETLRDTLNYYRNYIETEQKKGRSVADIIAAIGSGRMVANSVIQAKGQEGGYRETYDADWESGVGRDAGTSKSGFWQKAKVYAIIAAIVIVVIALLGIVIHVVWVLLPVILVIWLITWLVKMIQ
jgi:uncharacterized membrane protein